MPLVRQDYPDEEVLLIFHYTCKRCEEYYAVPHQKLMYRFKKHLSTDGAPWFGIPRVIEHIWEVLDTCTKCFADRPHDGPNFTLQATRPPQNATSPQPSPTSAKKIIPLTLEEL